MRKCKKGHFLCGFAALKQYPYRRLLLILYAMKKKLLSLLLALWMVCLLSSGMAFAGGRLAPRRAAA